MAKTNPLAKIRTATDIMGMDVRGWQRLSMERAAATGQTESKGRVVAYINHGRWVALCECNTGMLVQPTCSVVACLACGAVYDVDLPDEDTRAAIEAALLPRAEQNRNWLPVEPVEKLIAENEEHGINRPCADCPLKR